MNQEEYQNLLNQLGLVNIKDPGVKNMADITQSLLDIVRSQSERIQRLERKLEAYIDRQAAYEFEGI